MKLLNIYGQFDNHAEAKIVGNREGLRALKDLLDKVLSNTKDNSVTDSGNDDSIFASDGEGYPLTVTMNNEKWEWDEGNGKIPDTFWNRSESYPQYILREIDLGIIDFKDQIKIDYFAGELEIGVERKR